MIVRSYPTDARPASHIGSSHPRAVFVGSYPPRECGIATFDASVGGLGGCPYAPGAAGNLATEDLLFMLDGLGIETGIALPRVVEASRHLARALGRRPPGRYLAAVWGENEVVGDRS